MIDTQGNQRLKTLKDTHAAILRAKKVCLPSLPRVRGIPLVATHIGFGFNAAVLWYRRIPTGLYCGFAGSSGQERGCSFVASSGTSAGEGGGSISHYRES